MLKRQLLIILSLVFCTLAATALPSEVPRQSWTSDISNLTPLDRPVPIPWGAKLPFPWTIIQGTWMAEKGGFKSYFSFRVIKDRSSKEKQVLVSQIDAVTCDIIALGTGIATNKTVSAQMRNVIDGRIYSLALNSFEENVLPEELNTKSINGQAVLMSISLVNTNTLPHYLGIQKMTNRLDLNCELTANYP